MKAEDYTIIERYLKNISDDDERQIVEDRLSSDQEFKAVFEEEQKLFLSISRTQFNAIDDSIQGSFSELEQEGYFKEHSEKNTVNSRSVIIWIMSTAAIIGSLIYANVQYSNHAIFQSGNQKIGFETPQLSRSAEQPEMLSEMSKVKSLISDEKWNEASDILLAIPKTEANFLEGQLHLAYIYLKTDLLDESISVSDDIISQTIDPIKAHSAEWLKLQALIKSNRAFEPLMNQIIDNPKHTFRNDVVRANKKRSRFWRKLVITN